MTVEQMRQFIESTSKTGSILGMESIVRLCERLENPQNYGKIIHIAGTNGKGSTGTLIESALISMGFKVGRYTSPAVFQYEEIFMVNHQPIQPERLAQIMERVKRACDDIVQDGFPHPTIFEVETAVAFCYFEEEECEYTLIEVGMGGRTDATNVIANPLVSVITSISYDHMQFLGDRLEEIAYMKAGIIKPGKLVVALRQAMEVNRVIEQEVACQDQTTQTNKRRRLFWACTENLEVLEMNYEGMRIRWKEQYECLIPMTGICQRENISCALEVLDVLSNEGYLVKHEKECFYQDYIEVKKGFETCTWPGRFETIWRKPLCIVDGCHNKDAAVKLAETIRQVLSGYRIHFVIGVLADKDYQGIFQEVLPLGVGASCISPNNPRALKKERLQEVATQYLSDVRCFDTVELAMEHEMAECQTDKDMILVFGSLSYLGEVKRYVNEICESSDS